MFCSVTQSFRTQCFLIKPICRIENKVQNISFELINSKGLWQILLYCNWGSLTNWNIQWRVLRNRSFEEVPFVVWKTGSRLDRCCHVLYQIPLSSSLDFVDRHWDNITCGNAKHCRWQLSFFPLCFLEIDRISFLLVVTWLFRLLQFSLFVWWGRYCQLAVSCKWVWSSE